MKNVMAGDPEDPDDQVSCEEFNEMTGGNCYPTATPSTCEGTDGTTYSYASSSGSC